VIPVLVGLALLHEHDLRTRQREASQVRQQTLVQLETMLDGVHATAVAAVPLADAPCVDVVDTLRRRTAAVPQLRSLLVVRDGMVHCSSLADEVTEGPALFGPHQETLALAAGNAVAPDRPLLLYRWKQGSRQVIAVMDALHAWQSATVGRVEDGDAWRVAGMQLDANGQLQPRATPEFAQANEVASSRYPIALVADPSNAVPRPSPRSLQAAALLAMLAVIPGGYLFRHFAGRRQPRHRAFRRALRKGEFIPYYQPLKRAADREWAGVEVLARWAHPTRGLQVPGNFMADLERTEFILPMTAHLMQQAASELVEMLPALPPRFHVSFNITPAHLSGRWLPEQCRRFLSAFPPGSVRLVLELTEREQVDVDEGVHAVLDEVRRMGVRIALDDFGVGHSNLSHLQELRVDALKIDRGFIAPLTGRGDMTPILRTILDLAHRLELDVVAEGVETPGQADVLTEHGVMLLQGYLFARPMAAPDLLAALEGAAASSRALNGRGVNSQTHDFERESSAADGVGREASTLSVSPTEAEQNRPIVPFPE